MADNINYIQQYYDDITAGKVTVSKKVKAVYHHLVQQLNNTESEYYYNDDKAKRVIRFIEAFCKHTKGSKANQPFLLETWQKALISAAYGFIHKTTGLRQYKEIVLIIARKNGKSALASALALYHLFADGEEGAEIYSCATKKDQSKIIWQMSADMIKKSETLRQHAKIYISEIKSKINNGVYRPLSSDSNTLDGLNVSCALIDELHALKNSDLYNVITDGISARQQPMIIVTSTNGMIRDSIFDTKYNECKRIIDGYTSGDYTDNSVLPIVYELDDRKEVFNPDAWQKANPNLRISKQIKYLQDKVNKAKADSTLLANLLCKDFNMPVNSAVAFLDANKVINPAKIDMEYLRGCYYIGGYDLSQVVDLTSACMLFKKQNDENIYMKFMFFIPAEKLAEYENRDKKPYSLWHEKGLLRLSNGKTINPLDVHQWYKDMQQEYDVLPYKYGYDAWGSAALVEKQRMEYGKDICISVHQGKKTLSIPMQKIKPLIEDRIINYDNNPIVTWNFACVEADIDINGNCQPKKDRNKDGIRIDAFAAALNAYVIYLQEEENYMYMNT